MANPIALDGRALSGTTGATLDPILSLRQRIRLAPGGFARIAFATGAVPDREAAIALSMKYSDAGSASRTFALAATQLSIGLRHLGLTLDERGEFTVDGLMPGLYDVTVDVDGVREAAEKVTIARDGESVEVTLAIDLSAAPPREDAP